MALRYGKPKPWANLYSSAAWKRLRQVHLAGSPLCVMCEKAGVVTAAQVVDHKFAHKGNIDLFLDAGNLQSLCKLHHDSSKQREEKRGVVMGCDVNGNPIDASHHWNKMP